MSPAAAAPRAGPSAPRRTAQRAWSAPSPALLACFHEAAEWLACRFNHHAVAADDQPAGLTLPACTSHSPPIRLALAASPAGSGGWRRTAATAAPPRRSAEGGAA
jgi:hypothetical protein